MSEKPKKRLVGWTQYLMTTQYKGLHYIAGIFCWIGGLFSLAFSVLLFSVLLSINQYNSGFASSFLLLSMSGGGVACGIGAFWAGTAMFKNAKEIAHVALITRHNTGDLPEIETLVRPSDLPPSHQQAELLRAAPQGSETPVEELLRATTTNGRGEA